MKCVHGNEACAICGHRVYERNTADQREVISPSPKGDNLGMAAAVRQASTDHYRMRKDHQSALSVQVGGDHYKDRRIQPVQYIEANKLQFLEGCVVKRVTRHDKPTGKGKQDIEKAIHELQLLLELRYGN